MENQETENINRDGNKKNIDDINSEGIKVLEEDDNSFEYGLRNIEESKVFTKEEIFNKLKSSENINKVGKEVKNILSKMEGRYANFIREYYTVREEAGIDGKINVDDPKSIFEKEYIRILEEINKIEKSINLAGDEINLLNFYENISEQLYNLQEKSSSEMIADLADGLFTSKELMGYDNVINVLNGESTELFESHDNRIKFQELLKKKTDIQLIGNCFSIKEGFGAFEDVYKELLKRLNGENLFKKLDGYEESKDWTKEIITKLIVKSLFARGKISDFEKWINGYDKKDDLLNKIKDSLINDSDFVRAFLSHIDLVQEHEVFKGFIKYLEENSEVYNRCLELKQGYGEKNVEVLQQDKNINFIGIYDNEDDGGGRKFFDRDVAYTENKTTKVKMSTKYPGFVMDEQDSTENNLMKKVVFKKGNDSMTFVLLKTKNDQLTDGFKLEDMYKMALGRLDKNDYNVFALRGHCYTTMDMASALGDLEMVGEDDIIIDGGCWNYDNIGYYMEAGIKGEIFAYRGQGRGNSTEALLNKLYEIKKKKGNYKDFLDWIEKQKVSPDNKDTKYIGQQIITPNSAYSLYMKAEYEINNKQDKKAEKDSYDEQGDLDEMSKPGDIDYSGSEEGDI